MRKRLILTLFSCIIVSVSVVLVLVLISKKVSTSKGSFLRAFRQHAINELLDLNIKVNSYYLAGVTANTVFLGNYEAPLHVLSIDCSTGDSTHHSIQIAGINDQKFWSIQLKVDSPNFYLYDGVVPRIFKGNTFNWKADRFKYDTEFFQDIEPIASNSFAIKSLLGRNRDASLGKISVTEPHFTFMPEILKKQVDGFFCTDGYLKYDGQFNRLIYLYRYRNEYIVLDTSLQVISRATTIDTNSVAKIKIATIQSTGSRVFQTPPLVVNDKCSVYGKYLFVNSALLSNNEGDDALKEASVIDVYSLNNNKYLFSFYIFDHHTGEKLTQFVVTNDRLVALFRTYVQIYEINNEYLPGQ